MKLRTREFGEIEIDEGGILSFVSPIYGFDDYSLYVLLYDDEAESPFCWLQSVERQDICFALVDPWAVAEDYQPGLADQTRKQLGLEEGEEPVYRAIAVLPQRIQDATANLKSPIIINPSKRCAVQAILEQDYPIRARLLPDEEDAQC